MRDRTDRVIGRVALVLTAVVLVGVAITLTLALRSRGASPTAYGVGDTVDLPRRYFDQHAATLVIVVKAGCSACERSAPFHQTLQEAAQASGVGVQWVHAEQASPDELGRIRVVPSVLLLDQRGVVLEMKQGALPEDEQRALIERVRKGPGT